MYVSSLPLKSIRGLRNNQCTVLIKNILPMEKKSLRQQYTEFILGKREDDEDDEMYEMFLQSLTLKELEELAYSLQEPDDDFDEQL